MSGTHKPRELKPSFIVRPRRQFIDEGGRAKFKTSFDGVPEPSVTWKKDEKVLENSSKYKIYEKNSFCFLEVLSVTPDDNGDYTVIITNNLGSAEVSAELEVFSKPKPRTPSSLTSRIEPSFDKELSDITTAEGSTLKLECLLKGHPKPFIQWYFNGKMLRRSHGAQESFDGTSATLTIKDVCQKHGGQYECLASNILGEVRTACVITVQASSSSPDEMKRASQDQQEKTEQSSESLHKNDLQTMKEKEVSETKKEMNLEKEAKKEAMPPSDFKESTLKKVESVTPKTLLVEEEPNNTEKEALKREVDLTKKKSASLLIGKKITESELSEAGGQNEVQGTPKSNITGDTEKEISLTGKGTVKAKEQELIITERLESYESENRVLTERLGQYENEIKDVASKLADSEEQNSNLSERLLHIESENSDLVAQLKKSKDENSKVRETLEMCKNESTDLKQKLSELGQGAEELTEKLVKAENDNSHLAERLAESESEKAGLVETFTRNVEEINSLKKQLKEHEDVAQGSAEKLIKYEEENNSLTERLRNVEIENGELLEKLRKYEDENKCSVEKIMQYSNENRDLIEQLEKYEQEKKMLVEKVASFEREMSDMAEKCGKYESGNKSLIEQVSRLTGLLAEEQDRNVGLQTDVENRVKVVTQLTERCDQLRLENNELHGARSELLEEMAKYKHNVPLMEQQLVELNKEKDDLMGTRSSLELELDVHKQRCKELEDKVVTVQQVVHEFEALKQKFSDLEQEKIRLVESAAVEVEDVKHSAEAEIRQMKERLTMEKHQLVDGFELRQNEMKSLIDGLEAEKDRLQGQYQRDLDGLISENGELKVQTAQLVDSLEQVKNNMDVIQGTCDRLQQERAVLEQDISDMKNCHRELEDQISILRDEKHSLEDELQNKQSLLNSLTEKVDSLEAEVKTCQEDLEKREELLTVYAANEEEYSQYRDTLARGIVVLRNEVHGAKQELEAVRRDVCSQTNSFMDQFRCFSHSLELVTQTAAEAEHHLRDNVQKLREQSEKDRQQHAAEVSELQAEKGQLEAELGALEQRQQSSSNEIKMLLKEKAALEDQCKEAVSSLERQIELNVASLNADKQVLMELHNKQLEELQQAINVLKSEKAELSDEFAGKLNEIENLKEALSTAKSELDAAIGDLNTKRSDLESLAAEKSHLQSLYEQLQNEKIVWQEQSKDLSGKLEDITRESNSTEEKLKAEISGILQEKNDLLVRLHELNEERSGLDTRLRMSTEEHKDEVEKLVKEISDLKEKERLLESECMSQVEKLVKEISDLKEKERLLESEYTSQVENLKSVNDSVVAKMEEQYQAVVSKKNDIQVELSNQLSNYEDETNRIRAEKERMISEQQARVELFTAELAELRDKYQEVEKENESLKLELAQVTRDSELCIVQLKEEQQQQMDRLRQEHETHKKHLENELEDLKRRSVEEKSNSDPANIELKERLAKLEQIHQARTDDVEVEMKKKDLELEEKLNAIREENERVILKLEEENRELLTTVDEFKKKEECTEKEEGRTSQTSVSHDECLKESLSQATEEHLQTMMAMQSQIEVLQSARSSLVSEYSDREQQLVQQYEERAAELKQHIAALQREVDELRQSNGRLLQDVGERVCEGTLQNANVEPWNEATQADRASSDHVKCQKEIAEYRDIVKTYLRMVDTEGATTSSDEVSPDRLKALLDLLIEQKHQLLSDLKEKDQIIQAIQEPGQKHIGDEVFSPSDATNKQIDELKNEVQMLRQQLHQSEGDKSAVEKDLGKLSAYIEEQEVVKRQLTQERNQLLTELKEIKKSSVVQADHSEDGVKATECDERQLSSSSSDGEQSSTSGNDQLSSSAPHQAQLSKVIQKFERKIQKLKEQHKTELKVLEFNLTESHRLEADKIRKGVVEELEDGYRKRLHELENNFIQKENALKAELERKFVEELQNVKQELADRHKQELKEVRENVEQKLTGEVAKVSRSQETECRKTDSQCVEWRVKADTLYRESSLPASTAVCQMEDDNHVEGFQEEKDEDLQIRVKQLEDENKFLRTRLENQNLGMQESLQEELLVMYSRYDALLKENQELSSKLEPHISMTSEMDPVKHESQIASEDGHLGGFIDWKLKCEALEKENKSLRAELHVCGPAGMEHVAAPEPGPGKRTGAQSTSLIPTQPTGLEEMPSADLEGASSEGAKSGSSEQTQQACSEQESHLVKDDRSVRDGGDFQVFSQTLDTCTIVQKEYHTLHTQIEGLKTVFVPSDDRGELTELQERCKQLSKSNEQLQSEHQNLLSKYRELIQELEELKVLLGKSKDKSKKDYIKMKARALSLSKDNECLKRRIMELEQVATSAPQSADQQSVMQVDQQASDTGLERSQVDAKSLDETSKTTYTTVDKGTSTVDICVACTEVETAADQKCNLCMASLVERSGIQANKGTAVVEQDQSRAVSASSQSSKDKGISRSDYEKTQRMYSDLMEEYNTLKTVTLATLEENYQRLVEKHSELRQAMEKQAETLQSKIKRLEQESQKHQSDKKKQDTLSKKLREMEEAVSRSEERRLQVEEELRRERTKHASRLKELEHQLREEKDNTRELRDQIGQEMNIWRPLRLCINTTLVVIALVYAYLHHRNTIRRC